MERSAADRAALGLLILVFAGVFAGASARAQTIIVPGQGGAGQSGAGMTLTADALRDLPASADVFGLLETVVPEVVADGFESAGLNTGRVPRLGAHGCSWTQTLFRLDHAEITSPTRSGTPMLIPELLPWDRIDVRTGLQPIDVDAPGLAITLEPRRPSAAWTAVADGWLGPGSGPGPGSAVPSIARLDGWSLADVLVSGPLVPNRLGLVSTGTWARTSSFERADPTRLRGTLASFFAHLVWTPTGRDEIRTIAWTQRSRAPLPGRLAFGQPLASEQDAAVDVQTSWDRRLHEDGLMAVFGSFIRESRANTLQAPGAISIERLRDGPVEALLYPGSGNDRVWTMGVQVATATDRASDGDQPPGAQNGAPVPVHRHVLRAAIEASGSSTDTTADAAGTVQEFVDRQPARIWRYQIPPRISLWREVTLTGYASDRVAIAPGVIVEGGTRFELVSGSARASSREVRWRNWLPRANVRWDVARAGGLLAGLAVFTGYSRHGYRLPLQWLSYGDPVAPAGDVFQWSGGPAGPLVSHVGPGTGGDPAFSAIDPDLQRPTADEAIAGIEARPHRSVLIRFTGLARRERRLAAVVDRETFASGYGVTTIPDPGVDLANQTHPGLLPIYNRLPASFGTDRYLLTNPDGEEATFVGLDLTARLEAARGFLMAGATAGRAQGPAGSVGFHAVENDQGVIGDRLVDPNAATFARGRLFTDRAYTIKLAAALRFPKDVQAGIAARYQDGQPFSRIVVVDVNQGRDAIRAFTNGESRFTYVMTLDARAEKAFHLGRYMVTVVADAFNALNLSHEVEEAVTADGPFRAVAAVQPPRAFRLGARLRF